MSSSVSVEPFIDIYKVAHITSSAAIVAVGAAATAVGHLGSMAADKVNELLEQAEQRRLERQRLEMSKNKAILARINHYLANKEVTTRQELEKNLADLNKKSEQIRDAVLRDLSAMKLELEKVDLSGEIADIKAESAVADSKIDLSSHTIDDLLNLVDRLSVFDKTEARKLLRLIDEIDPSLPGRIDALAYQLKISISRAAEIFANEIRYFDELEAMKESLAADSTDPSFSEEFRRLVAAESPINQAAFDKLTRIYEGYHAFVSLQKVIPELKANDVGSITDKFLKFTPDDFIFSLNLHLLKQGYKIYDENGNIISNITNKCYVGLDIGPDYQVMIRTTIEGKITFKFVRVVADEKDLAVTTEYQRQKDKEATKKWCSYLKEMKKNLNLLGVKTDFQELKDADTELLVILNKELASEQLNNFRKIETNRGLTQSI